MTVLDGGVEVDLAVMYVCIQILIYGEKLRLSVG
jgi:hypothetical protein